MRRRTGCRRSWRRRQPLFRAFEAHLGTATFYILNPRGEISWVMRDPRGIDVEIARDLLRRSLESRPDPGAP